MGLRGIMVCVDYSDILALTLPYNRHHFERVMVVTSLRDKATVDLALGLGCDVHQTNAFYDDGAHFNKWKALEQGLDVFGRRGWLCLMDADVCWPKVLSLPHQQFLTTSLTWTKGYLYTPRRHMLVDIPNSIPCEDTWRAFPLHPQDREFAGYSQIFHCDDPVILNSTVPWHETNWTHAGGADSFFQAKWDSAHKIRPPFNVLHLGNAGVNWCGRVSAYVDGSTDALACERARTLHTLRMQRQRGVVDPFAAERIRRPHAE